MAIAGIGVDLTTVSRFKRCLANPRFLERVYGPEEQALLQSRAGEAALRTAAANFAAKEAFGKALGTGILQEFSLCQVQVLRAENGRPYLAFSGDAQALMTRRNLRAHVSLTHEADIAAAFVLLETQEQEQV